MCSAKARATSLRVCSETIWPAGAPSLRRPKMSRPARCLLRMAAAEMTASLSSAVERLSSTVSDSFWRMGAYIDLYGVYLKDAITPAA